MPVTVPFSQPVKDSVPKVDNAIAVGEDLEFQRKWWQFERITWIIFAFIILCDVLGLFGRGYLAKAERHTSDGTLRLTYERIERGSTPSIMTFHFSPGAVHEGHVQLFVSQSIVKTLGAQRISPQPSSSMLAENGITYTFPAADSGGIVEIALEPSFPGIHKFSTGIPGGEHLDAKVVVVP